MCIDCVFLGWAEKGEGRFRKGKHGEPRQARFVSGYSNRRSLWGGKCKLYWYSWKAIEHSLPNTANKGEEHHVPDHHQTDPVGCKVSGKVFLFSSVAGFKPLGPIQKSYNVKSQETKTLKTVRQKWKGTKTRSVVSTSYKRAAEVGIWWLLLYSSLVKPEGEQESPFLSFLMPFVQGTSFLNCNKSALWILVKLGQFTLTLESSLSSAFNFMLQLHCAANKSKSFALHFIGHKIYQYNIQHRTAAIGWQNT